MNGMEGQRYWRPEGYVSHVAVVQLTVRERQRMHYGPAGTRTPVQFFTSGRPVTSSESRSILILWPLRMNLPSGMATMRPPKPRKPPVRTCRPTTFPLGPVATARTSPTRVPSDENTMRPTRLCDAGASEGFTAGALGAGAPSASGCGFGTACGVEGTGCPGIDGRCAGA